MLTVRRYWRQALVVGSFTFGAIWLLRALLRFQKRSLASNSLASTSSVSTAHSTSANTSPSSTIATSSTSSTSLSAASLVSSSSESSFKKPQLFPLVQGLELYEDVIAAEQQQSVLDFVNDQLRLGKEKKLPKHTYLPVAAHHAAMAKSREMLQYGAYTHANRVEAEVKLSALPPELQGVVELLVARGVFSAEEQPDSCTINCYEQGSWLPPHIDSLAFSRPFATLSLLSATRVLLGDNLTHEVTDSGVNFSNAQLEVTMPIGSVLKLAGPAADVYQHGLPPHAAPRVSLTFRRRSKELVNQIETAYTKQQEHSVSKHQQKTAAKLQKKAQRKEAKKNKQPEVKEAKEVEKGKSQPVHVPLPSEEVCDPCATPSLEREHVQAVYDTIATQWHGTRYQAWPKVDAFIRSLPQGSLIADVGCGNGKNLPACNAVGFGMGSDISGGLALIAMKEGHELAVADVMNLPYRSGCCDAVLCIAVLHHLSTPQRRVRAVAECTRLLRVGGRALFYAWAQEQDEGRSGHRFGTQDVLVPFHARVREKDTPGFEESGAIDAQHVSSYTSSSSDSVSSTSSTSTSSSVVASAETSSQTSSLGLLQATHGVLDSSKAAVVFQRYCHVYKQGELEDLVSQVPGVRLHDVYFDTGNWAVIVEKTK